jgi:hypothetical protein
MTLYVLCTWRVVLPSPIRKKAFKVEKIIKTHYKIEKRSILRFCGSVERYFEQKSCFAQ